MYIVTSILLTVTALITGFVIKRYGGLLFKSSGHTDNFFSEQAAKAEVN